MTEAPEQVDIARLTAEIVSAYVSNNRIALSDVGGLITAVAGELDKVGAEPEPPAEEKQQPAVPVRRSIRPDHLVCLVCGKAQKMLKRHLAVKHGLTPAQYRARFELKPDYPMAAPNYVQQRREVALEIGLGRPRKPARRRRKGAARPQDAEVAEAAGAEAGD